MSNRVQTDRAYNLLENPYSYPGMVDRKNIAENLRLWVYPSFEPFVSFTLAHQKNEYFVRRVIWDHRTKTMTDEPQTYCGEVRVEKSVLEDMSSKLSRIELKPFALSDLIGIDGIRCGIEFGDYCLTTKLSWWDAAIPENWKALQEWHSEYINKLNGLFSQSSIDIEAALTSA
ncbi:hypothetical protein ACUR5C_09730 [Aliikangiella sp. IMCC44653]